jgi:hypothetical protein
MSIHTGTRAATDNLILSIDAENPKSFGGVNFVANSSYSATDWGSYFPANTTFTTGIDAPDGTNTAIRVACANTGASLIRVLFPAFTPNGTDSYVSSFYARLITPTFGPGLLSTDVADGNPSNNYGPSLIANTWVRVQTSGVPTAVSKSFIDLISDSTTNATVDFWGVQLEPGVNATPLTVTTGTTKTSRAKTVFDMSLANTSTVTFTGTSRYTTNPEKFDTNATAITQQSHLTLTSPIVFSDTSEYSMEFWVRLRSGADATFHSLAGKNSTNEWLIIQADNTAGSSWSVRYVDATSVYRNSLTVTSSNIQTSWNNICVTTDSSRNVRFYVNGVLLNSVAAASTLFNVNAIAGGYSAGGNFYPLQGSLAVCRMYARRLSDDEVRSNFNSKRSRFGV